MVDNQGRIKGRVSIIDIIIVLAIVGIIAGIVYRRAAPHIYDILRPDSEFIVVFEVNRIRSIIAHDTVRVGDMLFRQHERQALGRIIDVEHLPAIDVMHRTDGTIILAEMEDRYRAFITVECVGSITDRGFFVNGSKHVAEGSEMVLVSNRVILPDSVVYAISEVKP